MKEETNLSPPVLLELPPEELKHISVDASNEKIIMDIFKKIYPGISLKLMSAGKPFSLNSIKFNDKTALLNLLYYKIYNFLNEEHAGLYWCAAQETWWGYGKKYLRYNIRREPAGYYVRRECQSLTARPAPRFHLAQDCVRLLERNKTAHDNYYYPDLASAQVAAATDHDLALDTTKSLLWRWGNDMKTLYATAGDLDYIIRVETPGNRPRHIAVDKRNLQEGPQILGNIKTDLPSVRAAARFCQNDLAQSKSFAPPILEVI